MPGKISNYLENALLSHILGLSTYTFPTTGNLKLAIFTAFTEADDGDTKTEVTGGSYARQAITFSAASAGSTTNSALVSFPTATANWGTANYWAVMDNAANQVLYWGQVSNPMTVNTGEKLEIDPSQLTISLSGAMSTVLANACLESTLRGTSYTLTAPTHISLISSYTNDTTLTEVSDVNYTRQAITWATVASGASSNTARLQWLAAAADYNVNYVAAYTASSAGNLLFRSALSSTKTVQAGKNFRIEAGDFALSLD